MLHTINLLNTRIHKLHRKTNKLKLIIFVLIIWNITLTIPTISQAKQEPITVDDVIENLSQPPVDIPKFDDIQTQIINEESIPVLPEHIGE